MQIEHVPLDQIVVPEVRVTSHFSEEALAQFRLSVATTGLREPLRCIREGGRIILVNGLHRLQEAQARGDETVPCVITEGTLQEAVLDNLVTSGLHGRPKASEMRKAIEVLASEYEMDPIDIRKKTGFSQDYIENLMWVNRGIPDLQAALDDEKLSVGHAVLIAQIEQPDVQARVLDLQLAYRWTVADLRSHIRAVQQRVQELADAPPPEAPEPLPAPVYRCRYCRSEVESSDLVMVPTCPSCFADALSSARSKPPIGAPPP